MDSSASLAEHLAKRHGHPSLSVSLLNSPVPRRKAFCFEASDEGHPEMSAAPGSYSASKDALVALAEAGFEGKSGTVLQV